MAMKDLIHRLQPFQIYTVLLLSISYYLVQLLLSHTTHSLTLLVDSYHMLCNIMALTGSLVMIKVRIGEFSVLKIIHFFWSLVLIGCIFFPLKTQHCNANKSNQSSQTSIDKPGDESSFIDSNTVARRHNRSLNNTFGWTRIDILTMLSVGIFMAATCFSLLGMQRK